MLFANMNQTTDQDDAARRIRRLRSAGVNRDSLRPNRASLAQYRHLTNYPLRERLLTDLGNHCLGHAFLTEPGEQQQNPSGG
jgi:hypothetical protein